MRCRAILLRPGRFAGVATMVPGAFQIIEGLVVGLQRGPPGLGVINVGLDMAISCALAVHGREMEYA